MSEENENNININDIISSQNEDKNKVEENDKNNYNNSNYSI